MCTQISMDDYRLDLDRKPLTVVKAKAIEVVQTNYDELFDGFDHLQAVTFSYGMSFVEEVVRKVQTAEVLFGSEAHVKMDVKEIMAHQEYTLLNLSRHPYLVEQVENGLAHFWVAHSSLALIHSKFYILSAADGRTRVICGSLNLSGRAFKGEDQIESITVFDNDSLAYHHFSNEFETMKDLSFDKISKESIYAETKAQENGEQISVEDLPVSKNERVNQAGVIVDESDLSDEQIDYISDLASLVNKYREFSPKPEQDGKVLFTPEKIKELVKAQKNAAENWETRKKRCPELVLDYETDRFAFNGKSYPLNYDSELVRQDITQLMSMFDGYNQFIGDSERILEMQKGYFRVMCYMMASPFLGRVRWEAHQAGYAETDFPLFVIIKGPRNTGKTALVESIKQLMFGRKLVKLSPENFTSRGIRAIFFECKGVPVLFDDIDNSRFTNHASESFKGTDYVFERNLFNHPLVVITTNNVNTVKPELMKRALTIGPDCVRDPGSNSLGHKHYHDAMSRLTGNFYKQYLERMLPEVHELLKSIREGKPEWVPDLFLVSSSVICELISEYGFDLPEYFCPVHSTDCLQ